ncbi:MAG: biotin/lipoyl-binding protein, partial [Edaphobacter sp.]
MPDEIPNTEAVPEEVPEKTPRRKFMVIAVVALLIIGASLFYWHSTFKESTDDAQVDGDLYQVSSRVSGQVVKVYVEDNQQVHVGQLLAEIDPRDYQVALEQAQANLASAQASAIQANVNVPIASVTAHTSVSTTSSDVQGALAAVSQAQKQAQAAEARVAQAKANQVKSDLDVERYTPLVQKDVISKQQFDGAVAQAAGNKAAVLESEAQVIAQQAAVSQALQRLSQARSQA